VTKELTNSEWAIANCELPMKRQTAVRRIERGSCCRFAIRYSLFSIHSFSVLCLLALFLFGASCPAATVALSTAAASRIDFQTFILSPADRPGWRQVTAFVGFSVRAGEGSEGVLLLPVDAVPEEVRARAMGLAQFDADTVHGRALEGAFHFHSSSERNTTAVLRAGICLAIGPPAWPLMAMHWPPRGGAFTAVVPRGSLTELPPHRLRKARILIGEKGLEELPILLRPAGAAAMAASSSRCVIAVFFEPGRVEERQFTLPAISGIRVSFLAPLGRQGKAEALRMPMVESLGRPPALTRIYAQADPDAAPEILVEGIDSSPSSAQWLVGRALAGFGYSEEFLRENARESAAVKLDAVRRRDGGLTARLISISEAMPEPPRVLFHHRPLGRVGTLRAWVGVALAWLLWPLSAASYLLLLWLSERACRWLSGMAPARLSPRQFAFLAAASPFITLFLALRYLLRKEPVVNDNVGDGALSILSEREYLALARLVTWVCFAALQLAILLLLVRLSLWISFS